MLGGGDRYSRWYAGHSQYRKAILYMLGTCLKEFTHLEVFDLVLVALVLVSSCGANLEPQSYHWCLEFYPCCLELQKSYIYTVYIYILHLKYQNVSY